MLHEFLGRCFQYPFRADADAAVGVENVEPTILLQCQVDYTLHIGFFSTVYLLGVDLNANMAVERLDLALVRVQVLSVQIANEDGFGALLSENMCCCSADAKWGVRSGNDNDLAPYSATLE